MTAGSPSLAGRLPLVWFVVSGAALLWLVPRPLAADAVGPFEPTECPQGSYVTSNHCGTVCVPSSECETDADCSGGRTCEARDLCISVESACGGVPVGTTYEVVRGTCATGGACGTGECESQMACVSVEPDAGADEPPEPPETSEGGCSVRPAMREPWPATMAVLLGVWVFRRRRRVL